MPVRDSAEWRHAIHNRKVINMDHDGNRKVMCAWDTCEKDAFQNNRVRVNNGTPGAPRYMNYVFCSERHRQYWLESVKPGRYGNLPAGYRRSIL